MARDFNYYDTFIAVARDCAASAGSPPRPSRSVTVAQYQFALLDGHPYEHDQNAMLFGSSLRTREDLPEDELAALRAAFFGRPQACVRASPLARTLGWGLHCDDAGRVALYGVETDEYRRLADDAALTQLRAMATRRA